MNTEEKTITPTPPSKGGGISMDTLSLLVEWTENNIRFEQDKIPFAEFALSILRDFPEANLKDIRNTFYVSK